MTTLSVLLILISFLGGIAAIVSFIISLIKKNQKLRKRSCYSLLGMIILFIAGGIILSLTGDITAPEIMTSELTIEYGQSVSVSDIAVATDDVDGQVALTISSVLPETAEVSDDLTAVVFPAPGEYIVTVSAMDQGGNESFEDTTVYVEDHVPPEFVEIPDQLDVDYGVSIGFSEEDNTANMIYVTAEDEITDVTFSFSDLQTISEGLTEASYTLTADALCLYDIGEYDVTITAEDEYGNAVSGIVHVTVVDTVLPEFSGLKNEYILSDNENAPDYLAGVAAVDEIDGDITDQIAVNDQNVSYGVPGEYTVTYSVADNSGNVSEKSVAVTVEDTTPPVLTLSQSSFSLTAGDDAPDYASVVSAEDAVEGILTDSVVIDDSAVDYSTPGTYEITYTISDSSGNVSSKTATVTVKNDSSTIVQSSEDTSDSDGNSDDSGETVYITKTGAKYHRGSCRYLSKSKIAISKSDAIAQGYEPCKVCNP